VSVDGLAVTANSATGYRGYRTFINKSQNVVRVLLYPNSGAPAIQIDARPTSTQTGDTLIPGNGEILPIGSFATRLIYSVDKPKRGGPGALRDLKLNFKRPREQAIVKMREASAASTFAQWVIVALLIVGAFYGGRFLYNACKKCEDKDKVKAAAS
jgi:hypothetical protein